MHKYFSKEYIISMEEFLKNYVLLDEYDRKLHRHLNHYDITELEIPYIKRIPLKVVSEEEVLSGNILLVESSGFKGKGTMVCAYKRPCLLMKGMKKND